MNCNGWQDRFTVVVKFVEGRACYGVVDKLDNRWVKRFKLYTKEAHAAAAAANYFKAEQRKLDKILLEGDSDV